MDVLSLLAVKSKFSIPQTFPAGRTKLILMMLISSSLHFSPLEGQTDKLLNVTQGAGRAGGGNHVHLFDTMAFAS